MNDTLVRSVVVRWWTMFGRGWGVKDTLERSEVPTENWRLDFLCGFPVMRDELEMEGQLLALHEAVMSRTSDPQHDQICPSFDLCPKKMEPLRERLQNGLVVVAAGEGVVGQFSAERQQRKGCDPG